MAVLFWGVGDYATTVVSMRYGVGYESTPGVAIIIREFGHLGHLGFKLAMFAAFAVIWRLLPRPFRIAVPVGFAVAGAVLSVGNLQVIAAGV
jgi:hypothetical protein